MLLVGIIFMWLGFFLGGIIEYAFGYRLVDEKSSV